MRLMRGLLTAALLLTGFASAQVFTLTDIGPQIWPTGINSRGQVSAYGFCCGFGEQALIWSKKAGLRELVSLDGSFSGALGINDHGDAVGFSANGADNPDGVLWSHKGGVFDFPGAEEGGQGNAINNAGQVVGFNATNDPTIGTTTAFFWSAQTGLVNIVTSTSGADFATANAISSDGTVVGAVGSSSNPSSFIWTQAKGMKIIPLPSSFATGIHKEFVVGSGACLAPRPCGAYHAYIWSHYGSFDLGTLPGDTSSAASAVNSSLQIVGMSLNSSGTSTAFFWKTRYPMMDLNKLVHAPGWRLVSATGINDCSQIVGYGTLNGVEHGFLLTVIPRKGHY
jgi:probable HAF family extracellular repeat protein